MDDIDLFINDNNPKYTLVNDQEKCMTCGSLFDLFPLECFHMKCKKCLISSAEKDLNNILCKICKNTVSYQYLKMVLGDEIMEKIEADSFKGLLISMGKQVVCPNRECNSIFFFEVGKVDYNIKDEKNKLISKQAAESYAQNRCKCSRCQKEFCTSCNYTPFHLGKTCEEQNKFKNALKCKYCLVEISDKNLGPLDNICNSAECKENFKIACPKKLICGHDCFGTKFDKECPPCLVPECDNYVNHYGQTGDDYCNICYSEGLGSAPIILFKCNHYVHFKCAEQCLKKKWIGPKITFNHSVCPCCKKFMDCPNTNPLQLLIQENKNLYDKIVKMSLERIKFENLEKDPMLIEPNSPFFGKKIDFALKKLSYYMCYECNKPYFAGLRDCRGGPDEENNPNREYNPKDLICGSHANIAGVAGKTDCPKHGKDFIEYKCKFCCQIASWFCWGTTHFCEDCHTRQCKGDYVSKYTKDKLPKCPGESKCGLRINHPANGEEYAMGCSVCRNSSDNLKEF
jgi:E3 ubiquitin-protein ligase MYCBP2